MRLPDLLPKKLEYCASAASLDVLYEQLIKKIEDAVLFFENALEDETWTERNGEFIQRLLHHFSQLSIKGNLNLILCARILTASRRHHAVLEGLIPEDVPIKLNDNEVVINNLFLQSSSGILRQIILKESSKEAFEAFFFPDLNSVDFISMREFVYTGQVRELWRRGIDELIQLLRQADAWHLEGLVQLCEESLVRYITNENVNKMLIMAYHKHWESLKQATIKFINHADSGLRLYSFKIGHLGVEFLDFSEGTLKRFDELKSIITELACSGQTAEDPLFGTVMKKVVRLFGVDISGTLKYNENFLEIPRQIESLNLSQCSWLNRDDLKDFARLCPEIQRLGLASNIQLNYVTWGELQKFRMLKYLDLSNCHQIKNEDLNIILKACGNLIELSLDNCPRINESGFFEVAKSVPHLVTLILSRCAISDSALVEITTKCRALSTIDLSYCEQITEKSILPLMKHAKRLEKLLLLRTRLSAQFINELKSLYPRIHIEI